MDIRTILTIIQVITSLTLIALILMQVQGSGLSMTFGGGGGFYRSKRGVEKLFFYGTIFLSIIFLGNALILFFLG